MAIAKQAMRVDEVRMELRAAIPVLLSSDCEEIQRNRRIAAGVARLRDSVLNHGDPASMTLFTALEGEVAASRHANVREDRVHLHLAEAYAPFMASGGAS